VRLRARGIPAGRSGILRRELARQKTAQSLGDDLEFPRKMYPRSMGESQLQFYNVGAASRCSFYYNLNSRGFAMQAQWTAIVRKKIKRFINMCILSSRYVTRTVSRCTRRAFCFARGNYCRSRPREDTRNDTKELRGSRGANNRHVAAFFMLVFVCVAKALRPLQVFKHLPKSFCQKTFFRSKSTFSYIFFFKYIF